MTSKMLNLFFVVCVFGKYVSGSLAPFIQPCRPTDKGCLIKSAQGTVPYLAAGVPALGLHPLDPVTIKHMATNEGGLNLQFTNTVIRGLKDCQVLDVERMGGQTLTELKCSVSLRGDYSLNGQLLVFPIEGQGRYKIDIRDIIVKTILDVAEERIGGQLYWIVKGWSHTSASPSYVNFQFENLFGGDKQLSNQIHKFANENWAEIFGEVSPPITKAIVSKIVEETSKLFRMVPISQLAL